MSTLIYCDDSGVGGLVDRSSGKYVAVGFDKLWPPQGDITELLLYASVSRLCRTFSGWQHCIGRTFYSTKTSGLIIQEVQEPGLLFSSVNSLMKFLRGTVARTPRALPVLIAGQRVWTEFQQSKR